tara:strand:+ start:229 stop:417 length:189 start_codon:yes stop_codon:yes gene_type:complete
MANNQVQQAVAKSNKLMNNVEIAINNFRIGQQELVKTVKAVSQHPNSRPTRKKQGKNIPNKN